MTHSLPVGDIALRLHQSGNDSLRLELEHGTLVVGDKPAVGYALIDGAIEFESVAERNRHVAESTFKDLRERLAGEPDLLYERAYDLWRYEIGHADQASGRLLGIAAGELDVLELGSQRIRRGERVFDVLHLIEAALPFIDALDLNSLIAVCDAKHVPTMNDLAGGAIHGAIETWLTTRPEQAIALHRLVLKDLADPTASLLCNAVVALSRTDYAAAVELAKADANNASPLRARVGTWTLGCLLLEEHAPAEGRTEVSEFIASLIERTDGDVRVQAVLAATRAMHDNSTFDVLLKRLATDGDQDVLSGVATALFLKAGDMLARGDIHEWLYLMTAVTPDFKGAIHNLDNAMARLLKQPAYVPIVVAALTQWAARHGRRMAIDKTLADLFHNTVEKLSCMETVWPALVTDWLLSDKQEHAACLAGVLTNLSDRESPPLRLDKGHLDALGPADLLFLARRMMGYVHDRNQLTSLALSMLDSRDAKARIFPILRALLVDEVGYDYPGSTVEACKAAAVSCASADATAFLSDVVDTLEQIGKSFSDLPHLNELRPPVRLRRQFALARAKQMSDSLKEAQKKSILRQIVTEIPIKAGKGTFNYHNATYGPSMQMSSISHSIELPRREVFDPVGNAIRLLGFRLAKRDEA